MGDKFHTRRRRHAARFHQRQQQEQEPEPGLEGEEVEETEPSSSADTEVGSTDEGTFRSRRRNMELERRRRLEEEEEEGEDGEDDDGIVLPGAVHFGGTRSSRNNNQTDDTSVMTPTSITFESEDVEDTSHSNNDYTATSVPVAVPADSTVRQQRNELNHLIEAELVPEHEIDEEMMLDRARKTIINTSPEAVQVQTVEELLQQEEEENALPKRRRLCTIFFGCIIVAAVAVGLGLGLSSKPGGGVDEGEPTLMPSASPSAVPTMSPTHSSLYMILNDELVDVVPDLEDVITSQDTSRPEYNAWNWMVTTDTTTSSYLSAESEEGSVNDNTRRLEEGEAADDFDVATMIVQRFVIATLYYAWTRDGTFQKLNDVFLNPTLNVCDWNGPYFENESFLNPIADEDNIHGIFCEITAEDGQNRNVVTRIDLSSNNLSGRGLQPILRKLTALSTSSMLF